MGGRAGGEDRGRLPRQWKRLHAQQTYLPPQPHIATTNCNAEITPPCESSRHGQRSVSLRDHPLHSPKDHCRLSGADCLGFGAGAGGREELSGAGSGAAPRTAGAGADGGRCGRPGLHRRAPVADSRAVLEVHENGAVAPSSAPPASPSFPRYAASGGGGSFSKLQRGF